MAEVDEREDLMERECEIAVVGAGIAGLACAHEAARRGRDVVVFERDVRARGASTRNFGMIWPIGQPFGPRRELAMTSRARWLELIDEAGWWHNDAGSLHVAYHDDEARVLEEYAEMAGRAGHPCRLLDPGDVKRLAPPVRMEGLRGGLASDTEFGIDPREVMAGLPGWLERRWGVRFAWEHTVVGFDAPRLSTTEGEWRAERLIVCSGDDLRTLYPGAMRAARLQRCKLQMMRSAAMPGSWRLGPMLAGGLTLRYYRSFEGCPSTWELLGRISSEHVEYDAFGIHVLVCQNERGELLIGDSHEWGTEFEPGRQERIDELVLGYLGRMVELDGMRVESRWTGSYCGDHAEPYVCLEPAENCLVITGLGGGGMTLAFGVADRVIGRMMEGGA